MQTSTDIAEAVAAVLKQRHQSIAVAESSSGGLISASLLSVAGASAYFLGGAIVYTKSARDNLIGITDSDMRDFRSASEPYAQLLASRIRELHNADWGLAETGASGPTGNRYGDAAGHCCIAVAGPHNIAVTLETGIPDRAENMQRFTSEALATLHQALLAAG